MAEGRTSPWRKPREDRVIHVVGSDFGIKICVKFCAWWMQAHDNSTAEKLSRVIDDRHSMSGLEAMAISPICFIASLIKIPAFWLTPKKREADHDQCLVAITAFCVLGGEIFMSSWRGAEISGSWLYFAMSIPVVFLLLVPAAAFFITSGPRPAPSTPTGIRLSFGAAFMLIFRSAMVYDTGDALTPRHTADETGQKSPSFQHIGCMLIMAATSSPATDGYLLPASLIYSTEICAFQTTETSICAF